MTRSRGDGVGADGERAVEPARRVTATMRPIVELLPYQRADIESPARFSWCCWSRQIGKSFTKSLRRLLRGIQRRRNQILLSAGERQSRELMLKVQQHCRALNMAISREAGRDELTARRGGLEIVAPGGVRIIGLPANPQTARGYTGDVLLDEFAMHRDDRAIWASVFPSVLRGDGELDVASTPKGQSNLFAELKANPQFTHSIVTLEEAVRAGLRVDVEELRRGMGDDELFRQEFGCEFLDEATAFLTYEQIAAIEDPAIERAYCVEALAERKGPLFAGIDIGRHRDLTVMWVLEEQATEAPGGAGAAVATLVTAGVRETQGEPFAGQMQAIRALLSVRGVRRCCIDAGGIGMALAEAAVTEFGASRVEAVTFTPGIKDELATRMRIRVEEGSIRIPVDEAIRNDWHSIRRTVATAGSARYEAERSPGGHADRFWAACLAVRAAGTRSGAIEGMRGARLRFQRSGVW